MKIAIDAMGGDHAPKNIIAGTIDAARSLGIQPYLVGLEKQIKEILEDYPTDGLGIEIVHAEDVVSMNDHALVALRGKKKSSIRVAADLLKQGEVHGVLSAGHTGAAMATVKVVRRFHDLFEIFIRQDLIRERGSRSCNLRSDHFHQTPTLSFFLSF